MLYLNDQLLYVKRKKKTINIKWLAQFFFNMYDLKQPAVSKIYTNRLKIKLQETLALIIQNIKTNRTLNNYTIYSLIESFYSHNAYSFKNIYRACIMSQALKGIHNQLWNTIVYSNIFDV